MAFFAAFRSQHHPLQLLKSGFLVWYRHNVNNYVNLLSNDALEHHPDLRGCWSCSPGDRVGYPAAYGIWRTIREER
jgi:hypothetical protein